MGKFFSVGGMRYDGSRNRDLPKHPGAAEFYKNREGTSHTASGCQPGEEIYIRGDNAVVLHEEHDSRSGETITWVRRSSQSDSGTYMVKWAPDQARSMKIREVRKTRD